MAEIDDSIAKKRITDVQNNAPAADDAALPRWNLDAIVSVAE